MTKTKYGAFQIKNGYVIQKNNVIMESTIKMHGQRTEQNIVCPRYFFMCCPEYKTRGAYLKRNADPPIRTNVVPERKNVAARNQNAHSFRCIGHSNCNIGDPR